MHWIKSKCTKTWMTHSTIHENKWKTAGGGSSVWFKREGPLEAQPIAKWHHITQFILNLIELKLKFELKIMAWGSGVVARWTRTNTISSVSTTLQKSSHDALQLPPPLVWRWSLWFSPKTAVEATCGVVCFTGLDAGTAVWTCSAHCPASQPCSCQRGTAGPEFSTDQLTNTVRRTFSQNSID